MVIHVIDDDEAVRESLEALLVVTGFDVKTYSCAEEYLAVSRPFRRLPACRRPYARNERTRPVAGALDSRTWHSGACSDGKPRDEADGAGPRAWRCGVPDQARSRGNARRGAPRRGLKVRIFPYPGPVPHKGYSRL